MYGNESPINLQVSRLGPTRIAGGTQIANLSGAACSKDALAVPLETDIYYLVRVSGQPGSYVLSNDVSGSGRRIPVLVHDGVYNFLHPGDPVENPQPGVEQSYVLPGDREYGAIRSSDARVHLQLIDAQGTAVAEGVGTGQGERLDLSQTNVDAFYVLQVVRRDRDAQAPTVALQWEPVQPVRASDNLIRGALGRSERLDPTWRAAVANGRVKARFAGTFGPRMDEIASARLTYLDANGKRVGALVLTSPSELVRAGVPGPLPAEVARTGRLPTEVNDYVPMNTVAMRVDLIPPRGGAADAKRKVDESRFAAFELVLAEFPEASTSTRK